MAQGAGRWGINEKGLRGRLHAHLASLGTAWRLLPPRQVRALLSDKGQPVPGEAELDETFVLCDEDGSGTIDEGEFIKLYTLAATETSADEAVLRERFREQVAG